MYKYVFSHRIKLHLQRSSFWSGWFSSCDAQAFCPNEVSLSVTHLWQGLCDLRTYEMPVGWKTQEILSKTASNAPKWQHGCLLDPLIAQCLQASDPPQAAQTLGSPHTGSGAVWEHKQEHLQVKPFRTPNSNGLNRNFSFRVKLEYGQTSQFFPKLILPQPGYFLYRYCLKG